MVCNSFCVFIYNRWVEININKLYIIINFYFNCIKVLKRMEVYSHKDTFGI